MMEAIVVPNKPNVDRPGPNHDRMSVWRFGYLLLKARFRLEPRFDKRYSRQSCLSYAIGSHFDRQDSSSDSIEIGIGMNVAERHALLQKVGTGFEPVLFPLCAV